MRIVVAILTYMPDRRKSDRLLGDRKLQELSRPSAIRGNRKIPDVCKALGIQAINDFRLYSILKFSIP